jgi:hypothetical protein
VDFFFQRIDAFEGLISFSSNSSTSARAPR